MWLRPRLLHLCKIWWKSLHGGLLRKEVKYNPIFIYTPLLSDSPTGQIFCQIFTLDGTNDVDSRNGVFTNFLQDVEALV